MKIKPKSSIPRIGFKFYWGNYEYIIIKEDDDIWSLKSIMGVNDQVIYTINKETLQKSLNNENTITN